MPQHCDDASDPVLIENNGKCVAPQSGVTPLFSMRTGSLAS